MARDRLLLRGIFTFCMGALGASACGDDDAPPGSGGSGGTGGSAEAGATGGRTATGGKSNSGGGPSAGGALVEPDASAGGSGGQPQPGDECSRAVIPTEDDRPEESDEGDSLPPITLAM